MMEHIRQYDWYALQTDQCFVTEHGLDNCVTQKILSNIFTNPLLTEQPSESEEEGKRAKLNWSQIFKKRNKDKNSHRIFVPGIRTPPPFTRLSALTAEQHHQCLKVLCARSPHILPDEFLPRPTKVDLQVFEDVKEIYEKEQQEYITWAKSLWTNGQCIRALRPKPMIENVYEAEFKVRANQMKCFPKVFEVVAQIPLDAPGEYEMVLQEELVNVKTSDLPKARYTSNLQSAVYVVRLCRVPEPCEKHPVRLILPNEKSLSVLPLIEVNRELAEYAGSHDAQFVASEGALRCLLERRAWALPVSVYNVCTADGGSSNVIVLGSEFSNKQENVLTRNFRALRHLLELSLIPEAELAKAAPAHKPLDPGPAAKPCKGPGPDLSDDEDGNLFIDFIGESDSQFATKDSDEDRSIHSADNEMPAEEQGEGQSEKADEKKDTTAGIFGDYTCTCHESMFEAPPPRSYKKWQIRNKLTHENYDLIVHSAHKCQGSSGELLLEPIPEYQPELGASKQAEDRITSLALSLALRDNASVLNVRLDAQSGEIITVEESTREQFISQHGDRAAAVAGVIHTALNQLQGLVPGQYIIQHEPQHGDNALLYAPRNTGEEQQLRLELDCAQLAEADEARSVKPPPHLTPALLPCHKFRKILPCAFTHYPTQIVKPKKQTQRKKTPPRALKFPKKKGRKPKAE